MTSADLAFTIMVCTFILSVTVVRAVRWISLGKVQREALKCGKDVSLGAREWQ